MKNKRLCFFLSVCVVFLGVLGSFFVLGRSDETAYAVDQQSSPSYQPIYDGQDISGFALDYTVYSSLTPYPMNVYLSAFNGLYNVAADRHGMAGCSYRITLDYGGGVTGYVLIDIPYYPGSDPYSIHVIRGVSDTLLFEYNLDTSSVTSTSTYVFTPVDTNRIVVTGFYVYDDSSSSFYVVASSASDSYYQRVLYNLSLLLPFYGVDNQYQAGYDAGLEDGGMTQAEIDAIRQEGYDAGYQASQDTFQEQLDTSYNDGYAAGEEAGYDVGLEEGIPLGYDTGYSDGYFYGVQETIAGANGFSWYGLFTAVIDVPVRVFSSLLDFEVFGVNLAGFFVSVISIILIVFILKKIL